MALASIISLVLSATGACLAIVCFAMAFAGTRQRRQGDEAAFERLQDEVWELREAAAARNRAEAANEAKSRFLASVSHEVRTPLNGILGMAELLTGTNLSAEQETYVSAIRSSGSALASLVDEILDLAKIEAGRVDLVDEPFDLAGVVQGVVELLAPRAQEKGIEIAAIIADDVPREIVSDAIRLRQILLNVAGNAIKFTETGGVGVRVLAQSADGMFAIEVADSGPGIPPARREAIFEDFEQADETTARRHGGSGLGLAISRRLAERMKGTLTLLDAAPTSDTARSGSTFRLELPLVPAQTLAPAREVSPAVDGRRVLIVAASIFEAPFMVDMLAARGGEAAHVSTIDEAHRALAAASWDVLVIDRAFGASVAADLAEAGRLHGVDRSLVLLSPFERRICERDDLSGFEGWLIKPVRSDSLLRQVAATRAKAVSRGGVAVSGTRQTVLLAEDNPINALLSVRHLERIGAHVVHAPDGLSALALAETAIQAGRPYEAVIVDIRMPGMDGITLARRIRLAEAAHGMSRAQIVAVTADLAEADCRSARIAGIDACLCKPISFARLEETLIGARRAYA